MAPTRALACIAGAALSIFLAACERPAAPGPQPPVPEPSAPPPSPPAPAPQAACPPGALATEEAVMAELARKARAQGAVRVIVRVAAPATVQAAAARTGAVEAFAQAGVTRVTPITERLPLLVAELTEAQLAAMQGSGTITSWSEDRIAFPTLAETTALVGAPALQLAGGGGRGLAVAILDTGVDRNHPFLSGRVVSEACFSTTSPASGSTSLCPNGQASQTGQGAARPCTGEGCDHGTHVAGIAAGKGSPASGVAPDADIIAIQVFSRFTGSACGGAGGSCIASFTSDQIRALDHLAQLASQRKVASANLSLGGGSSPAACDDDPTKPVIDQLRAAGVATAIASGNDGFRSAVSYPACISTAVTVGASNDRDRLAPFSNCSATVDLNAPGVDVRSSVPGGGFATFSGTSMATPHVAGAFAALRSLHPDAPLDQIEAALKSTGPNVDGRPRISLAAAHVALGSSQEAIVASDTGGPQVQPTGLSQLESLPPDDLVRVIVSVSPKAGAAQADAATIAAAETAARAAGVSHVERMGSQPMLVLEGTASQLRRLSESGTVSGIQLDRIAPATAKSASPN